ncbi:MAG: endonuclease domain-containing protein [Pyrinomonadaceae bacterium]
MDKDLNTDSPSTSGPITPRGERGHIAHYRGGFDFTGLLARARKLRRGQTTAEEFLWRMLRNRQFGGYKFRRQHQYGNYIVDFYCHQAELVVECDGPIHEENEQWQHDQERSIYLNSQGLRILRFANDDILNHPEQVLATIGRKLPPSSREG